MKPYALAQLADVADPDGPESPGAQWLSLIEDEAKELRAYYKRAQLDNSRLGDEVYERADSLVPVHTHERWRVFVDLAAYREDPYGELDDDGSDLTRSAGAALYLIARRLLGVLLDDDGPYGPDCVEETP